jgi:acyl carrier protein
MPMEIAELKKAFAASGLKVKVEKLEDDTSLKEQGFDSLDVSYVLLHLEEKYGYAITDEELGELRTLNDYVRLINTKYP